MVRMRRWFSEDMSRAVGGGRLGLVSSVDALFGVGRERMVKDVKEPMGRILNVFVGEEVVVGGLGLEALVGVAAGEDGAMERTMRLVIGSAV